MSTELNIETLYAFIVRDDDGTEGIVGSLMPDGRWMPLVGADTKRIESLEPFAQEAADATGKTIQIVHFTKREHVRNIEPNRLNPLRSVKLAGKCIGIYGPDGRGAA